MTQTKRPAPLAQESRPIRNNAANEFTAKSAGSDCARARAEVFLIEYITANVDERGEVHARACINAAMLAGIPEAAVTKARFINRDLIGSRKAGRRAGWVWYPLFPLTQDSSDGESSVSGSSGWYEPNRLDWPVDEAVAW